MLMVLGLFAECWNYWLLYIVLDNVKFDVWINNFANVGVLKYPSNTIVEFRIVNNKNGIFQAKK